MPILKGRLLELSAALTLLSAACSTHVTFAPPGLPQLSSRACASGRIASVKNPTTGDVSVFIDRRMEGGYTNVIKLGTVSAESTIEFELSVDDGTSLQIEWAPGAGTHGEDLNQVRYRIRCQSPR
jgi:hypothetical protein